ncbi:MAG TPA: hypothetical protein VFU31_22695 [Candidatus Binatia bacterium]|nr:hypothetical protein [Candidatus Binatia bacterium]
MKTELDVIPKTKPLEVDVAMEAMPDPTVTDDQALEAFQRAGLAKVEANTVRDLAAIGIYVKGVGVLKIQRGKAMVTQQLLFEAMRIAADHMAAIQNDEKLKLKPKSKTNDLVRSMGGLAGLARASNESQRLAMELESLTVGAGSPVSDGPQPVSSFAPKAKIQPVATTIHNHGPTQVLVQERKPE